MNNNSVNPWRDYAISALSRYWPNQSKLIQQLPMPKMPMLPDTVEPILTFVELPEWGREVGINNRLLVPACCIAQEANPSWQQTDWLAAIFWYLSANAEQNIEKKQGPIHSYSYRLKGWDSRMWEYAWVNRIALFLRRWATIVFGRTETDLFGPLPQAEIILTHDVDAVHKTLSIRGKQTAFHLFNGVRHLFRGQVMQAWRKIQTAAHFFFSRSDYCRLQEMAAMEELHGMRSLFTFYGGFSDGPKSLKCCLIDPGYDIMSASLQPVLRRLNEGGWQIGLHGSCLSWRDSERLAQEKARIEIAFGGVVTTCRQHWLFFSWEDTWAEQEKAGLELDMTLGFNDRPGFRTAAALHYHPWNTETSSMRSLQIVPTVLMDSHLYDYAVYTPEERHQVMSRLIDEIWQVGGVASILWHPHTLSPDYGWADGYQDLLGIMESMHA